MDRQTDGQTDRHWWLQYPTCPKGWDVQIIGASTLGVRGQLVYIQVIWPNRPSVEAPIVQMIWEKWTITKCPFNSNIV